MSFFLVGQKFMFSKIYILYIFICIYIYTKVFLLHLIKAEERILKKKQDMEKLENIN